MDIGPVSNPTSNLRAADRIGGNAAHQWDLSPVQIMGLAGTRNRKRPTGRRRR